MIARLKGIIEDVKPTEILLDVQGVGYQVYIPFSTFEYIKDLKEITIHTYTLHREDSLKLFGFYTQEEKQLFALLLNTSGIGPSMALSILSGIRIPDFIQAVKDENPSLLIRIPGIGKTKAEKIIFELKRKLKKLELFPASPTREGFLLHDAVDALTSLGFDEGKSNAVVKDILKHNPGIPIEDIIKSALKVL